MKKQGLHHKSVELWCHSKMVSRGAGRHPSLSCATGLLSSAWPIVYIDRKIWVQPVPWSRTSLDKTLYDDYLCFLALNKQQIWWTRIQRIYRNVGSLETLKQVRIPPTTK